MWEGAELRLGRYGRKTRAQPFLCCLIPAQNTKEMGIPDSNLAFQIVMNVCLSREESRAYLIKNLLA